MIRIKEWHRTVLLLALLVIAIGLIIWLRTGYEASSVDTLQQ